jgi:A/G-specific adenine glycosylase
VSVPPVALEEMQSAVLEWYAENARDLAFRRTADPWSVLVSEVIAQQTQAARAAEAWTRFIALFPTPTALAAASPAAVIRAWRGIGYNRRAVALRGAAIEIVNDHGGRVPDTYDELVRLPGIGPYTARAVLAIAFNRPVAALDTNIRRVLTRAFVGDDDEPPRRFQALADGYVPAGRAATWTQALMDIGAAFCRARNPRCDACPLRASCAYASRTGAIGDTGSAAQRSPRRPSPQFESTIRWLRGRILDRLRDAPDGRWVTFDSQIGAHDVDAVHAALLDLARDGMLELDDSGHRARLRTGG